MAEFGAGLGLVLFLLLLVLIVAWIVLPVAVIGTKPILCEIREQQRMTNELLTAILRANERAPRQAAPQASALEQAYKAATKP
jgi:hypothetical protein